MGLKTFRAHLLRTRKMKGSMRVKTSYEVASTQAARADFARRLRGGRRKLQVEWTEEGNGVFRIAIEGEVGDIERLLVELEKVAKPL